MTRSQRASRAGRRAVVLLLVLSSGWQAHAQGAPEANSAQRQPAPPAWQWGLVLLLGAGLGVLGSRLLRRKPHAAPETAPPPQTVPAAPPATVARPPAQNLPRENRPAAVVPTAPPARPSGKGGGRSGESEAERQRRKGMDQHWRDKNLTKKPAPPTQKPAENRPKLSEKVPPALPSRNPNPSPMAPSLPTPDELLSLGQTVDLTPAPSIHELMEATAPPATEALVPEEAAAPVPTGPVQYYAPAPDVPSIEHRKLSPNALPQMPLLVTLPHAEATTARFSFSPQADQSRIIGNGIQELKEFFAFEVPLTEQFTTIKNLAPGQLEKRDDAWHVVHKASIALS